MPRISFALSVCFLTLYLAAGMSVAARADEERRAYATSQPSPYPTVSAPAATAPQPQSRPHPAGNASRLHPEACASLCRVFEFLGALERPAPPKPIPTS
jgi:hypothetical protein